MIHAKDLWYLIILECHNMFPVYRSSKILPKFSWKKFPIFSKKFVPTLLGLQNHILGAFGTGMPNGNLTVKKVNVSRFNIAKIPRKTYLTYPRF